MVDHIIEGIKIGSSKQEYGLVYNLNNLGFASLTTFIDSIMNMSRHCVNLIKICATSNMGKRKGRLKSIQGHQRKPRLSWTTLFFVKSKCIFTIRNLYSNITHFRRQVTYGFNMSSYSKSSFWPLIVRIFVSLEN
jgi:hypothetical protein